MAALPPDDDGSFELALPGVKDNASPNPKSKKKGKAKAKPKKTSAQAKPKTEKKKGKDSEQAQRTTDIAEGQTSGTKKPKTEAGQDYYDHATTFPGQSLGCII